MTAFDTQVTVEQGVLINVIGQLKVSISSLNLVHFFLS